MNETAVPIVVALIAAVPAMLVALSGRKHAKQANDAVNNRAKGSPTLQEDIAEMRVDMAALAVMFGEHIASGEDRSRAQDLG